MSNENEVFSRPQDEAVSYSLEQFSLYCSTPGVKGKRARLVFGERNGAPRITVFTGMESPKAIWMGFDPVTFEMFLMKLEQVAKAKEQVSDRIENMERSKDDPKKYTVRNTLNFGKNEEGVVYIEIEERGTKFMFELEPPFWHTFYRISDGQRMTNAEFSVVRAIGIANTLRQVFGRWSGRLQPYRSNGSKKPASENGGYKQAPASSGNYDEDYEY